jgi:hypothetical protein
MVCPMCITAAIVVSGYTPPVECAGLIQFVGSATSPPPVSKRFAAYRMS